MIEKKDSNKKLSWFWKWFLNNKAVNALLIILLVLLIILTFSKVSWILKPVGQFFSVVGFPILLAAVLYYLLIPCVDWLERKTKLGKGWAITLIFVVLTLLLIWGVAILIPIIRDQSLSIIKNWPIYWENITRQVNGWLSDPNFKPIKSQLNNINDSVTKLLTEQTKGLVSGTISSIGSIVSVVSTIAIALVTAPFILFYLLKDGHQLPQYIANFMPVRYRKTTLNVLYEINTQISQYVRGQLLVAFAVSIMFIIGFNLVSLQFAVTLGILAGFLNLIPYLGSFLAMVPVVVIALVDSPMMLVKVLIVFMIEQTIEGKVVSPLVLGNNLNIHPVTIIIVLLTAGKIFGVIGVIIGIPGYAIIKVLISHLFLWYKDVSGLYEEENDPLLIISDDDRENL